MDNCHSSPTTEPLTGFTYWGIRRRSSPPFESPFFHLPLGLWPAKRDSELSLRLIFTDGESGISLTEASSKGANNGVPGPEVRGYSRCREKWTPITIPPPPAPVLLPSIFESPMRPVKFFNFINEYDGGATPGPLRRGTTDAAPLPNNAGPKRSTVTDPREFLGSIHSERTRNAQRLRITKLLFLHQVGRNATRTCHLETCYERDAKINGGERMHE